MTTLTKSSNTVATFGERLDKAVQADDRSQTQIAKDAGVSGQTLIRYKKRDEIDLTRSDTRENVRALVSVLGIREEWLLDGVGEMRSSTVKPRREEREAHGHIGGEQSAQYAYPLPMSDSDTSRDNVVVDVRDAKRVYSDRLERVRVHEVRSSAMQGVVAKGAQVQYVESSSYEGPGMYLISLDDERPWPAYVRKLNATQWEIETMNRKEPLIISRGDDGVWRNEHGHETNLTIHGTCERWEQSEVRLQ